MQRKKKLALDWLGIFCSSACAIHCLIVPIAVIVSPTLASYFESKWVHIGMMLSVICIAGISFYSNKKLHKCNRPMELGLFGVGFLVPAICFEHVFGLEIKGLEIILTMIGCAFFIIAHLDNIKCLNLYLQKVKQ